MVALDEAHESSFHLYNKQSGVSGSGVKNKRTHDRDIYAGMQRNFQKWDKGAIELSYS